MDCTSVTASRPETLPDSSSAWFALMVASLSPAAEAAAAFICAMTWFSKAVRFGTASAFAISAIASRPLRCFTRACAACNGLPTSGLTPSPFCCARTSNPADAQNMAAAHRTACRALRFMRTLLVQELLCADQADLGDAIALRRGHHVGDGLVRDQLVGAQVELRLHRLRRRAQELRIQRGAIDLLAVPQDGAVEIDLDGDHHGRLQGWRRVAHRHVELHRVRLDRYRDDQHDEQYQHHVDERRGVDVDHDFGVAARAAAYVRCHRMFPWVRALAAGETARGRLGDEADLEDGGALAGGDHFADGLVTRVLVGADVDLGLRHHYRHLLQLLENL